MTSNTKVQIEPTHDRVLVKRLDPEAKSPGGIIIPDNAREKPVEGRVLAVGPGAVVDGAIRPCAVRAGDRVLFGKYAGTEVCLDGAETLLLLRDDDVLAVVRGRD